MTLGRLVEVLSVNPARILGVPGGALTVGAPADITVLAPDLPVTVNARTFRSLGRNTPFDGWSLRGGVMATIVGGRTPRRSTPTTTVGIGFALAERAARAPLPSL